MPPAALSHSDLDTADQSKSGSIASGITLRPSMRRCYCWPTVRAPAPPAFPRSPAGRGERKNVTRSWCCRPKQALIWSAGAVFSPLSPPSLLLSKKLLQGRSRRAHPSKSTYLHICSDVGIFSPVLLAGNAVVIQLAAESGHLGSHCGRPLPLSSYL